MMGLLIKPIGQPEAEISIDIGTGICNVVGIESGLAPTSISTCTSYTGSEKWDGLQIQDDIHDSKQQQNDRRVGWPQNS